MQGQEDPCARAGEAYALADELRSIASEGLEYARDEYGRRRHDRVLRCSAQLVVGLERRPAEAVLRDHTGDLHHATPQIGVDAMVLEEGRELLIQRTDNSPWCMPGGSVEVGETLARVAERELREEAGIEGKARRVVALFDSRLWHSGMKQHMVHLVFLVERLSGTPTRSSESLAAGYFAPSALPPLSYGHRDWLPLVLARVKENEPGAYFDP